MNDLIMKLKKNSDMFWDALFYLLDKNKREPERIKEEGSIVCFIDDFFSYQLVLTDKKAYIINWKNPEERCGVDLSIAKRNSFPYTKLLDWYLQSAVIRKE